MRILWDGRDETGRCGLQATAGIYDGIVPVPRLLMDRDVVTVNNDVIGVAATLAFGAYCEGPLELPKPVSPEAASAIENYLKPSAVRVVNVNYEPFASPAGTANMYVDHQGTFESPVQNRWGVTRTTTLSILDSTSFVGSLMSLNGVAVSANARLIADLSPGAFSYAPYLSIALLHAETLQAGNIVVSPDLFCDDVAVESAKKLLQGCKVRLTVAQSDEQLGSNISWLDA